MTPGSRTAARRRMCALVAVLFLAAAGCSGNAVEDATPSRTAEPTRPASGTTARASDAPEASAPGAPGAPPVTIMGAGDIAKDLPTATATGLLIQAAEPDAVFTVGDNAYPDGSRSDYAARYEPTWGAFRDRTHPVPGNHEYHTGGAAGYVDYFGRQNVTNGVDGGLYYAWDAGNGWRVYALNSEISTTGAQLRWLREDLAAHAGGRFVLVVHRPRYTSGREHPPSEDVCPLWDAVAATGGLEIVLAGHNHQYERFAPMDCAGRASPDGARSFVIGSGGAPLYGFGRTQHGSEFRNNTDFGVLRLVLYEASYEWEFIASGIARAGSATVDAGNAGQILDKGSADV